MQRRNRIALHFNGWLTSSTPSRCAVDGVSPERNAAEDERAVGFSAGGEGGALAGERERHEGDGIAVKADGAADQPVVPAANAGEAKSSSAATNAARKGA